MRNPILLTTLCVSLDSCCYILLTTIVRYEMYSEEPESTPNGLGPNTALELSYYSNGEVVW